jgi:ketosteroid isomerase-like protein
VSDELVPPEEMARRLRAGLDAFNRGDYDRVVAFFHPDVAYLPAGGQPPIRGAGGLREWMEPSAFDRQTIEPTEITVAGDRILVRLRSKARGAGSGIEMELDSWSVMTIDADGFVTRIESYFLHEEQEARAAAGLGAGESG